ASFEWTEYPFYSKNILVNNADGRGVMNIDSLIPGDYVFANGPIFPVSTQTPQVEENHFGISPNPSSGAVQLRGDLADAGDLSFEVYDVSGRLVDRLETELPAGDFTLDHDFSILRNGLYVVRALDEKGRKIGVQQLEILK
ncbi:MAG: T9SS type A sorting domain-containing protein, partial [Bacteroidota bacterium]